MLKEHSRPARQVKGAPGVALFIIASRAFNDAFSTLPDVCAHQCALGARLILLPQFCTIFVFAA